MDGMNRILANSQPNWGAKGTSTFFGKKQRTMTYGQEAESNKTEKSKELRQLIRSLDQDSSTGSADYMVKGIWEQSGTKDSEKAKKNAKPVKYNYKEVASKIRQAKTSLSAGQAVLAARRKVLEIRRKIASHDGDAEELQLSLTHAKRMEMVARKKKHHLELEEMVAQTQKRDEKQDKFEDASTDVKNALVSAEEEKIVKQEDAIFEEREKMIEEAMDSLSENETQNAEEMLDRFNEMVAKFGEEELKELEEAMEMLECMEVVDPHMSKEDLEELKRKHRAAENKALVKADMDYLKGMIKHQVEKGGGIPGMSMAGSSSGSAVASVSIGATVSAPVATAEVPSGGVIDIQI